MCTDIVSVRVVCFSLYEDFSDVDGCVVGWIVRLLFLIVQYTAGNVTDLLWILPAYASL